MIASVVELLLALICLGTAGRIIIQLLDRQRRPKRQDD